MSIAKGSTAIRSHVDVCDDRLLAVRALLDGQELDSSASTGAIYWEGLSELREADSGKVEAQLKGLSSEIAALKKQGDPGAAIQRLEQELPTLGANAERLLHSVDPQDQLSCLQSLRDQLHKLAGAAGTFGFSIPKDEGVHGALLVADPVVETPSDVATNEVESGEI